MPESKKDIGWINYLKAICIIAVFYRHSENFFGFELGEVHTFILPFYVNAFFFVSGYLLFRKQLSEPLISQSVRGYLTAGGIIMIGNILWRLMVPTLIFSTIEFLPSYMLRGRSFDLGIFLYKTIGGCTYWFTAALAVTELLIALMLLSRRRNIWFYFVLCCLLYALGRFMVVNDFSLFDKNPSLPWHYKHGLYSILFMAFGCLYWRYEKSINRIMNLYVLLLLTAVYFLCLVLWPETFHVMVSMLDKNGAGVVISLLVALVLIEWCKRIRYSKLLSYIGQNTIGFYFMSGALPIVLTLFIHKAFPQMVISGLLLVFVGSLVTAFAAVYLLNRYAPWLFDMRILWKHKQK